MIMVLLILLIVYRNLVTMMMPLITIGISLVTAQGILAGLAELGLGVSSQTMVFMSGVMFGAGTDYAVFLISRYHDYVRLGAESDQAVKRALASIGKVIGASAATVAVTFLAMVFTTLPVFSTVGPALAIAVSVAFVAAITVLPAIMVLAGRRGWIKPRRELTTRFWRRSGVRIVRRPRIHLVASLLVRRSSKERVRWWRQFMMACRIKISENSKEPNRAIRLSHGTSIQRSRPVPPAVH